MSHHAHIKVIGVGGAGSNAISRMAKQDIKGVELIVANTDAQDLRHAKAHTKIALGEKATGGLGTGMNPVLGKKAAEEDAAAVQQLVEDAEMVFVSAGLGGGTGTGAAPVIANIAKETGTLTIGIVTLPFAFEGSSRQHIAKRGLERMKQSVDALIVINNDRILQLAGGDLPIADAFASCDEVLNQAVRGITDLVVFPGIINVDFADVKSIMKNSGTALFGVGHAKGEKRAEKAARQAMNSPLLSMSAKGAKGVLFNVAGGPDISLAEIEEAAAVITSEMSSGAKIIFGASQNDAIKKGELKVTVIATGF